MSGLASIRGSLTALEARLAVLRADVAGLREADARVKELTARSTPREVVADVAAALGPESWFTRLVVADQARRLQVEEGLSYREAVLALAGVL